LKPKHFVINEKLTTDCVSLYNNAGLISKVSEEIASENTENLPLSTTPLLFDALHQESSVNIAQTL